MKSCRCSVAAVAFTLWLLSLPWLASAENWPHWRGPKFAGTTSETDLPTQWSKEHGLLWRLPLPGTGSASPVVWEDRVFVTSDDGDKLVLMCISSAGKELWRRVVAEGGGEEIRRSEGSHAAPSPGTDGRYVWAFMGNGYLACFDMDGKRLWSFDVAQRYGKIDMPFSMATSPIGHRDYIYLQLLHLSGAKVVAVDKATGKEVWSIQRPSEAMGKCKRSYASPLVYTFDGEEFLITHGQDYTVAHDLATGRERWRMGGYQNPNNYDPSMRIQMTPAIGPGVIVGAGARTAPLIAMRPGGRGNVTDDPKFLLWKQRMKLGTPSPVIADGLLYMLGSSGILTCLDAKTGAEIYKDRVGGSYRASPVYADGKLYLAARDGTVHVVQAGKKFKVLARNNVSDDELLSSTPAISGGRIYLRTFEGLYAVGKN